jgi:hypothetical protein
MNFMDKFSSKIGVTAVKWVAIGAVFVYGPSLVTYDMAEEYKGHSRYALLEYRSACEPNVKRAVLNMVESLPEFWNVLFAKERQRYLCETWKAQFETEELPAPTLGEAGTRFKADTPVENPLLEPVVDNSNLGEATN